MKPFSKFMHFPLHNHKFSLPSIIRKTIEKSGFTSSTTNIYLRHSYHSHIINNSSNNSSTSFHNMSIIEKSLTQQQKRLVCFVEGNIGSGKSTVCKELQKNYLDCISEQQRTDEWTLLDAYYEKVKKNMKDYNLNFELQKQIANTYFKHYFKYNFLNKEKRKYSLEELFNIEKLQNVLQKYQSIVKLHENYSQPINIIGKDSETTNNNTTSNEFILSVNNTNNMNQNFAIFFEGILSSSGVFTMMEYHKGMIEENHFNELLQNYDALNHGIQAHFVFYLKPKNNIDVCHDRILERNRSTESSAIQKDYLKAIEEYYDTFLNERVSKYFPVFVIDNSEMNPFETSRVIREITDCIHTEMEWK
ncbi:hypothetical protein ABK040_005113 [Willaertia magna]